MLQINGRLRLEVLWSELRRVLHEGIDCGPKQWKFRYALYGAFGVRGSVTADIHHRRHGNCKNAWIGAGLLLLKLEYGIILAFVCGPWETESWWGTLVDNAEELTANDEFMAVFEIIYPRIVIAKTGNRPPPEFGTEAHIKEPFFPAASARPAPLGVARGTGRARERRP